MEKDESNPMTSRERSRLRKSLFKEAAYLLRKGAEWADKKDETWPRVYADSALKILEAIKAL